MPASRFLKIVKKPAKFQSAVFMCQFLSPGTTLYYQVLICHNFACSRIRGAAPQKGTRISRSEWVWEQRWVTLWAQMGGAWQDWAKKANETTTITPNVLAQHPLCPACSPTVHFAARAAYL